MPSLTLRASEDLSCRGDIALVEADSDGRMRNKSSSPNRKAEANARTLSQEPIMNARFALLAGALLLGYAAAQEPEAELLQAEKLLREARIGSEGADVVRFFRDRSLSEEDHQRLTAAVEQLGNANFQKREKAVEELRRAGRKALPFLRAALRDGDLERARRAQLCIDKIDSSAEMLLLQAAAHVLAQRRPKEATEALLRYFPVAGDSAVEEAVLKALASVSVKDGT